MNTVRKSHSPALFRQFAVHSVTLSVFTFNVFTFSVLARATLFAEEAKPDAKPAAAPSAEQVSYHNQIRPIFQAKCQGCHQPAKAQGGYVMTSMDRLRAAGESGQPAVVAGKPTDSELIRQITLKDGKARMPKNGKPLHELEVELISRWIAEGALDDTPSNARERYDPEHPPIYTRQPVITSLDYSPDGSLLAVAGFHEVLLVNAADGQLAGRLIGLSERVQSVAFSPDGKKLAVAGGQPGRFGEIQVWNVASRKLALSAPVGFDTLYGVSWSPNGSHIAFGCGDNTLRAIDAKTGEQVLYQGAHTDWALDTVFTVDGSHVVSVGRDMTVKLTELATQRFIDNVTSITPGALKGGIHAVARHPKFDIVAVGGSDGTARCFRVFREAARKIGDDANHVFDLFPQTGRIFDVRFSPAGNRIASVSSLDNSGELIIATHNYDADTPANIKAIMGKVPGTRSPEERKALSAYREQGVKLLAHVKVAGAGLYACAFSHDGKSVAVAGTDGLVRVYETETGKPTTQFAPAPISDKPAPPVSGTKLASPLDAEASSVEALPTGTTVAAIEVRPPTVTLSNRFEYAQLLVTVRTADGETTDATRIAEYQFANAKIADASRSGLLRPLAEGSTKLTVRVAGHSVTVPVTVSAGAMADGFTADFVRDVNPVMSRLGCNQGTCHGSAGGKNGFKLSLRGYDPLYDVRSLTDDLASRRVNLASPDDSLMLLKTTGAVPHVGAQLTRPGEAYYAIIRSWIAAGAKLDLTAPRVAKIELTPTNPVVQRLGQRQQIRVLATSTDGRVKDVTREAFIESGNPEVATVDRSGVMTAVRRGEAPVLARYEGAYAATTLTVMGDRTGFVWFDPPKFNRVDELTAAKWRRLKIQPSDLSSDVEFIRRASLDLTGLPPTADQVREFLADGRDARAKRDALVDRLVGSPEYVEYWTNKWADLLQVNRKFLAPEGAAAFRKWIRAEVEANTPYDQFVRKVLTATGSNKDNPAASYYKVLRDPATMMENTTHLFLAVRFNCNKCHDHPFERWTQDQYYQTAAYFARTELRADPSSGNRKIGGTAVEGGKPFYEIVADRTAGEIKHDRTGEMTAPAFPYPSEPAVPTTDKSSRRELLAAWLTSADNQYFARSYVNRLWGYLFGVGIIEPIDDIRAGNPPTNPELLDYLTDEFVRSGFDARHVMRLIAKSRTYQLSVTTNKWNSDDKRNYSHALARRLPAEVMLDSVYRVTGSKSRFPGLPVGTRAAELPDSGVELPSGFLATFGRPVRESACECERTGGLQMGPVMALINGKTIADAIGDPANDLTRLTAEIKDDGQLVNELFMRVLNRPATPAEIKAAVEIITAVPRDHAKLVAARDQRAAELAPETARKEAARQAAITEAKTELDAYLAKVGAGIQAAEKARAERTAKAQAELDEYTKTLDPKQPEWEKTLGTPSQWVTLTAKTMKGPNGTVFTPEADGIVYVSGRNAKGAYTLTFETDLKDITGIKLEALASSRLPSRGPGRADNGNFVLSEFAVKAAAKAEPNKAKPVKLQNATADFSQAGYDVKTAIDGKVAATDNGWAVSPEFGKDHYAIFETAANVGNDGGTVLTVTLDHQFEDGKHSIGKFRISVTTSPRPVGVGIPQAISDIAKIEPAKRNPQQTDALRKFFREQDAGYRERAGALATASAPLPVDPKLKGLQDRFALVSQPLPEDPLLAQLKNDVNHSTQQLGNARLTAAQDLAWALINSPAFLFNR